MIIVIREKGVREYNLIIFDVGQVRMNRNLIVIGRTRVAGGRITVGAPVIGSSTVCFGA